jgi:hypothetical protein
MRENTMNYSDNWQPYLGDYDKFEYDIQLKNGVIVENCYPNAGKFNSISDEHNRQSFNEEDVKMIRFSNSPRYGLNSQVSDIPQYDWLDRFKAETFFDTDKDNKSPYLEEYAEWTNYYSQGLDWYNKPNQYVRPMAKIHNNDPCHCGSTKKYKKCCKGLD